MSDRAPTRVSLWPYLMAVCLLAPSVLAQPTPPTSTAPPTVEKPKQLPIKERIKLDTDKLNFSYVRDDTPVMSEKDNQQEFDAYNEVLIHARQFSIDELLTNAKTDVTFADLLNKTRRDFQFKLILIEGRLKRLRSLEPNRPLREAGITELYEGWIFPREAGIHMHDPICVLLTELPPGLSPQMEYMPAKLVRFPGYSFKLMRYESQDPDVKNPGQGKVRRAPLIMGRTLIVDPDPDNDGGRPWRTVFVPGILLAIVVIGGAVLFFSLYYNRGDKVYKTSQEERLKQNPFVPSGEPAPPTEPTS
jgi:hypothetical protein